MLKCSGRSQSHRRECSHNGNKKYRSPDGEPEGIHDTFIAGDNNLWQIKSEEVKPGEFVAVGTRVSSCDDEFTKVMKTGSPVPFGTVTPRDGNISIIMAGIQTYSSDSSSLLCMEHLSDKQAALEQKLKQQVEMMKDDPVFRKKYIEHKDRLERAYL